MLDVPVESSQDNANLQFEAFTEHIPKRTTRVSLVLSPRLKDLAVDRGDDPKIDLLPPLKLPDDEPK
jgi:hypothetical protein